MQRMPDVHGYDLAEFLELEPDQIAAAIYPEVKGQWDRVGQISEWNMLNDARQAHGGEVAARVSEGWQWLVNEGFVAPHHEYMGQFALTRRGLQVDLATHVADARALGLLRAANLDAALSTQVTPAFRRGQYDLAVFAAMREVEDRVRFEAPALATLVGVDLMKNAFRQGGPLADPGLAPGERTARMELFAGAFGIHRNPAGHGLVDYTDPQEAAEVVLLANNLLRQVARAAQATRRPGRPRARRARTP
jgi:uncharacterized protein (TIGR02391 family)